mgnify:CR=1 FL=1
MWQLGPDANRSEWRVVDTTYSFNLYDVVQTTDGPYAVGGRGTLITDRGNGWEIVLDDGPMTRQNQLRAIDVTDDGARIWLAGSSGALACYDVEQRRKYDYAYPEEMTSTWEAVTVSGERGTEKALAANGSGEVLPFTIDGFDVDWGHLEKPAEKGSTVAALASTPGGVGFVVDTSGNAFKTTAESGWEDIGVVNAQVTFDDVYAGANQQVYLAGGDGRIYRYDDSYHRWTPIDVTRTQSVLVGRREPQALVNVTDGDALRSVDVYEADDGRTQMTVLGADGTIYQRTAKERWEQLPSPTSADLYAFSLGDPDVAIGKNGTVLERPRGERRSTSNASDGGERTASDGGDAFDGRGESDDGRIGTE